MNDQKGAIAIVGSGSIGVAWAIVFAQAGHDVAIYDPDAARRTSARDEVRVRLEALNCFGLIEESMDAIMARIYWASALEKAVENATYVQECAPESLELKRTLFAEFERLTPTDAVLASSSSAITASAIADGLASRARCLVAHPGNPPYLLKVVELIPAPFTDLNATMRARDLLVRAGMAPVILRREIEGFLFNRLQGAVLREAYCLVRDGVATVDDIDLIMTEGLGPRWSIIGPFETADLNTRGGIEVHAARMGPAYARMGAERGQNDPWTAELVDEVARQRRKRLSLEEWEARVEWRDRQLMLLAKSSRADARAKSSSAPLNWPAPASS